MWEHVRCNRLYCTLNNPHINMNFRLNWPLINCPLGTLNSEEGCYVLRSV